MVSILKGVYRVLGAIFIVTFFFYFYVRLFHTLGVYHRAWRTTLLVGEFVSALSFLFQVVLRMRRPWSDTMNQEALKLEKRKNPLVTPMDGQDMEISVNLANEPLDTNYHVSVLIPCYNEPTEIIKRTVEAAIALDYDPELLDVYLCDDGDRDSRKEWIESLQQRGYDNVHYVRRPQERKGHSKAGNLNYALVYEIYGIGDCKEAELLRADDDFGTSKSLQRQYQDLYEDFFELESREIPETELFAVLDADMVCRPYMLKELVPYFINDKKMMGVQAPQTFHNVPTNADYFDSHNMGFFQYSLPAMSAWNTTTCCGTNVLFKARDACYAGFYPYVSITEDFGLAVSMHKKVGGTYSYHSKFVATGEAPEDLRQIFQQRSRWAKGNLMVCVSSFFYKSICGKNRLSLMQFINFSMFGWCYVTSAFVNPLFVFMNSLGVLFGLFPVGNLPLNVVLVLVGYYLLYCVMVFFTPSPRKHYLSMWVATKVGHFFSFLSLKAIYKVITSKLFGKSMVFKVTAKKQKDDEENEKEDAKNEAREIIDIIEKKPLKTEKSNVEKRDSSHRDIIYHYVMVGYMFLVIIFGYYVNIYRNGAPDLLPQVADERDETSRKLIRWICVLWTVELWIGYSLPIWYAHLPDDNQLQAFVLKVLCGLDNLVSIVLLVLAVLSAAAL